MSYICSSSSYKMQLLFTGTSSGLCERFCNACDDMLWRYTYALLSVVVIRQLASNLIQSMSYTWTRIIWWIKKERVIFTVWHSSFCQWFHTVCSMSKSCSQGSLLWWSDHPCWSNCRQSNENWMCYYNEKKRSSVAVCIRLFVPRRWPCGVLEKTLLLPSNQHSINSHIKFALYDTIRYDTVCLRVLRSWRDGQLNLAHGTETKKE